MAPIFVLRFPAEGCHLITAPSLDHQDHAESGPDRDSPREKSLHLIRVCGSGNVIIRGFDSPQDIPDTSSDKQRLMPGTSQPVDNGRCGGA